MNVRDKLCVKCELSTYCENTCISSEIVEGKKIMVVGEYPTSWDDKDNAVMSTRRDQILFDVLEKVIKADLSLFHFSYLVRCKPQDGNKPTEQHAAECLTYLEREIAILQPEVIITLGDLAFKTITGNSGITKNRGQVVMVELANQEIKVLPTFSPAYISNNEAALKNFATDLQTGYHIGIGYETNAKKSNTVICESVDDVIKLVGYIRETGICAFDFETTGLDIFDDTFKATLLSFSFQHGSSYAIPFEHFDTPFTNEDLIYIIKLLRDDVFRNPDVRKVAHNLKFDLNIARKYKMYPFRGRLDDTMLMHHLIDETKSAGLKSIVAEYFKAYEGYEEDVKQYKWDEVPLKLLADYAGADTDLTLRLATLLESYLIKDDRVYKVYRNLSIPALKKLAEMEWEGMYIDRDKLIDYIDETKEIYNSHLDSMRAYRQVVRYETKKAEEENQKAIDITLKKLDAAREKAKSRTKTIINLEQKLIDLKTGKVSAYEGINFNSPKQLTDLLYSKEGFGFLPVKDQKTKKPLISTSKDVLTRLPDRTGFIEDLFLARSISKTLSTYLEGIYTRLDKQDRVHTSFLQHGTQSGRLSSRDPNLQNIPSMAKLTSDVARKVTGFVKKVFIAPEGHKLMQFDYSQAELRIIASFANENNMLDAYNNDKDLHAVTGANMVSKTLDEFYQLDPKEQKRIRTRAKAGNFGLIYGMSAMGFKEYARTTYQVTLTDKEAEQTRNDFFKLYPSLLDYHDEYIAKARKFGYVRTLFGRRRLTPDINSQDGMKRSMDERVAINSPVQGTAGEFTIFAIALLRDRLDKRVKIVNTVHDSIILYVPDDLIEYTHDIVSRTCENLPTELYFGRTLNNVSMKVDAEISSENWGTLAEYQQEK